MKMIEMENESLKLQLEIQALDKYVADKSSPHMPLDTTDFFKKLDDSVSPGIQHSTPKERLPDMPDWPRTP